MKADLYQKFKKVIAREGLIFLPFGIGIFLFYRKATSWAHIMGIRDSIRLHSSDYEKAMRILYCYLLYLLIKFVIWAVKNLKKT